MIILVLYGPNLNLLGLASKGSGTRLTLDRLNRALRTKARGLGVELKIFQQQSEVEASKIIQRQRNKVNGVLLIPGVWARTGYLLKETLVLTGLPLAVFHLEPEGGPWGYSGESIFRDSALADEPGSTAEELCSRLADLASRLKS